MFRQIVLILVVLVAAVLPACAWQAPQGFVQTPIWPKSPPPGGAVKGPEVDRTPTDSKIAGRPVVLTTNVTRPTITVYPARGRNTGAAIVVFPGGGYKVLAMDLEGTEVCEVLSSMGITAVLLKYRVPSGPHPRSPMALQDAQRAISLVRQHAAEWHVNPQRVGVLGFSAGGHLSVACSTFPRAYKPVDATDRLSCRPDFAVVIYPGHLATRFTSTMSEAYADTLNDRIRVGRNTPPTFLLQAEDDPVDPVQNSLVYYAALKKAGVPVELHLYPRGGHAFGVRHVDKRPVTDWPHLLGTWLQTL